MMGRLEVLGRVLVFRRVTAAYVAANEAKAQVDPGVAEFHAFSANVYIGGAEFDLIGVFAGHNFLRFFCIASRRRIYFERFAVPTSKRGAGFVSALQEFR
jgi:hypothetical protein